MLCVLALAALAGAPLLAQDLTGNWQGTLKDQKDLRIILVVTKDGDHLQAKLYSIDETPQPFRISSVSQNGATVKFAIETNGTSYEGRISSDNNSITGTWTQGRCSTASGLRARHRRHGLGDTLPTNHRARRCPLLPTPSFEVSTIKPNNSGLRGLQVLTFRGRTFIAETLPSPT